jgi:hypothetical protein
VTFSLEGSPFSVLETFCTAYDLDGRAWSIRPSDDDDVVARSYSALNAKVKLGFILDGIQKLAKAPATVKFDEKSGTFLVTATRLQQSWVEGYFKSLHGKR